MIPPGRFNACYPFVVFRVFQHEKLLTGLAGDPVRFFILNVRIILESRLPRPDPVILNYETRSGIAGKRWSPNRPRPNRRRSRSLFRHHHCDRSLRSVYIPVSSLFLMCCFQRGSSDFGVKFSRVGCGNDSNCSRVIAVACAVAMSLPSRISPITK